EIIKWVSAPSNYHMDMSGKGGIMISEIQITEWMRTNDILGKIFGPLGHIEIVQRSEDLLKFFQHTESFTVDDLDTNQHRSIIHAIYSLLVPILGQFSDVVLAHLSILVRQLPFQFLDQAAINLIHHFVNIMTFNIINDKSSSDTTEDYSDLLSHTPAMATSPSVQQINNMEEASSDKSDDMDIEEEPKVKSKKRILMEMLVHCWRIAIDENDVDLTVSDGALHVVRSFLQATIWPKERLLFVDLCMKCLERHEATFYALNLLQAMIVTTTSLNSIWPHYRPSNATNKEASEFNEKYIYMIEMGRDFFEYLFVERRLSDLFFDDLKVWKAACKDLVSRESSVSAVGGLAGGLAGEATHNQTNTYLNDQILIGRHPYIIEAHVRLDFIVNTTLQCTRLYSFQNTSTRHSPARLISTPEHLDILWTEYIIRPLTSEESDEAFVSLRRLIAETAMQLRPHNLTSPPIPSSITESENIELEREVIQLTRSARSYRETPGGTPHDWREVCGGLFAIVHAIFERGLATLPPRLWTLHTLEFARLVIVVVNSGADVLVEDARGLDVRGEVIGSQMVWAVAMACSDEKVGREAIGLIVQWSLS
ncbi:hypothetical protein HK096_006840, partial [Nowakowskiella sp. JEL0078]